MTLAQRLLAYTLAVVFALAVAIAVVVDRSVHRQVVAQTNASLAREVRLVAARWPAAGEVDVYADEAGAALGHRVTLIAPTGEVLGDSEFDGAALSRLENHLNRPEVREALSRGEGFARRRSPSQGDEEFYVAVSSPRGIARVSVSTRSVDAIFAGARRDIALAALLAVIVAGALALVFSRRVSRPVLALRDVARAMAAGDLGRRPGLAAPGEVGDLALAVHELGEQLAARIETLRHEQALLTSLIEALDEGVLALDDRRNVVRVNRAGREIAGVDDEPPFPIDRLPRPLHHAVTTALRGEASASTELRIADRVLAVTTHPLASGGAVVALFDLTQVRRLEHVRTDFVANVSHELRTPLTVIGGFAETLDAPDLSDADRTRFVRAIRTQTSRMQKLVDDLLDLSRIESGGWLPKPEAIDVASVAQQAVESVRPAAHAKGVSVAADIAPDAATVRADRTAVAHILSNLLENAVRHTDHGHVTVFARAGGDGDWIGVRDTGAGIAEEHLPRIFERFYRVDPGRARESGGTGLGLAIVKHLAEAHGGRATAASTPGRGTEISVFFPRTGAAAHTGTTS